MMRSEPLSAYEQRVAARPDALFSSLTWLGVITSTYGFTVAPVTIGQAVIPCAEVPSPRRRLIGFPFCDYVEPLGARLDGAAIAAAMDGLASNWRVRVRVNDLSSQPPRELVSGSAHWSAVAVTGKDQWGGLRQRARRKIRAAETAGVTIRRATSTNDLRTFFELHLMLRKQKFRLVAQPYRFFQEIWRAFGAEDRCWLLLAERDGHTIAGTLFIRAGKTIYYKFNASTLEGGESGANYLILWDAIDRARAAGLTSVDLGLSPDDQAGLVQFKRSFASVEDTIIDVERQTNAPSEAERAALTDLVQLATDPRCPDYLTEAIGASVYSLFA
jgi:CelD/BcsL family acetyltransferase involved in cellulose biosynthesis